MVEAGGKVGEHRVFKDTPFLNLNEEGRSTEARPDRALWDTKGLAASLELCLEGWAENWA